MSVFAGPEIVNENLVMYLDAANLRSYPGSGTNWSDLINSKTGILNGPVFDSGSISFDGINDSNSIASLGFSSFIEFSVSVWFYSNLAQGMALVRASDSSNTFILHYRGAGFYLVGNDAIPSGYLGWQTVPVANQWIMLTGTWDGNVMKLYQNATKQTNELAFAGGVNGVLANINSIQLGYYFNASQPWTNGKIASCALYNRALSQSEITQNFNATRGRFGI